MIQIPIQTTMNTVQAAVVTALIVVGSVFLLIGTIGLLRLPDVYNRMHATSKATTLGASSIFLAGFVYFDAQAEGLSSLVGIVFLFITAPTGAHMISRSARKMGVEFSRGETWPERTEIGPRPETDDAESDQIGPEPDRSPPTEQHD